MITDKYIIHPKDIPLSVIEEALEESKKIINSSHASNKSLGGNDRSNKEIIRDTLVGKVGEYIIKHYYNYTNDPDKWHDLISPGGVKTEIKTRFKRFTTIESVNTQVRNLTKKYKESTWFNSTVVIIIFYDDISHEYEIFDVRRLTN